MSETRCAFREGGPGKNQCCLPTDHSGPHRTSGFYSPASLAPPRCEHNVLLTEPCDACLLAGYERPASRAPEGRPPTDWRCSLTLCAVGIPHRHPYSPDHPEVVEVYGDDGYAAQRVLWDACPECAGTGLRSRKRCERCQAGFVLVPAAPAVRPEGPEAPKPYDHLISHDALAEWGRMVGGVREEWRQAALAGHQWPCREVGGAEDCAGANCAAPAVRPEGPGTPVTARDALDAASLVPEERPPRCVGMLHYEHGVYWTCEKSLHQNVEPHEANVRGERRQWWGDDALLSESTVAAPLSRDTGGAPSEEPRFTSADLGEQWWRGFEAGYQRAEEHAAMSATHSPAEGRGTGEGMTLANVLAELGYAAQRVLWDACPECAGTGLRSRKRCERCQAGFVLVPAAPAVRPEGPEAPSEWCATPECGHHRSEHGRRPGFKAGCAAPLNGVDTSSGVCGCTGFVAAPLSRDTGTDFREECDPSLAGRDTEGPPSEPREDTVETTPGSGNVFADLGLSHPEERLAAAEFARVHGLTKAQRQALAEWLVQRGR